MLNSIESIFRFFRKFALFLSPLKYYRNDPPGYIPLHFSEVLRSIQSTCIKHTPTHWTLMCTYKKEVRCTEIYIHRAFDSKKPSLIFHHPSGETNHAFAYNFILGTTISTHANIFLIKAQHHTSTNDFLQHCTDSFLHHQLTFAGSVHAVNAIVNFHKKHTKTNILVSGASMGGIVASLHAYFFGTAHWYIPLVAYPNVGKIFMGQAYAYAISDWKHKHINPSYLKSFELSAPFPQSVTKRIIPILGTNDGIVLFSEAEAFWKKHNIPTINYPYGHFTPAIKRNAIRQIILNYLKNRR